MYNRPRIRRALPGTFVLAAVLICSFPIIGASVIPAEGQTATRRGDAKTGPPPASRAASRGEVRAKAGQVEADHPPVAPAAEAEAGWTEVEVNVALEECAHLLAPLAVEYEVSKPVRTGQCGTPAPVVLRGVASVELTPPAVVNCRIAAKLHEWVEEKLQPAAKLVLGSRIGRISTASAYSCRNRVGNVAERLSEHSFANALDISAFVTLDGQTLDILTHWGPTARDRHAQASAAPGALAGGDARALREIAADVVASTAQQDFLRRAHQDACGIFGTVLGPEANEAHRNHLHLDLASRRRGAYCE